MGFVYVLPEWIHHAFTFHLLTGLDALIDLSLSHNHPDLAIALFARITIMAGPARPGSSVATKRSGLRPPTRRAGSAVPDRHTSPAVTSRPTTTSGAVATARPSKPSPEQPTATGKRKDRDFEREINEDTSIHVVVRCRGRNQREIKENSGVVLSTEGVSGKQLDLSMGPNAISNKTYAFDKVFSPAADQTLVYEEVVLPVLNEVS